MNTPTFPIQETHYFNETETSQEQEPEFGDFCSYSVNVINSLHLELQNDTEQTSTEHEQEFQSGIKDRSDEDDLNGVDGQGSHAAQLAGAELPEQRIYNYECFRCRGVLVKLCLLRLCEPAFPNLSQPLNSGPAAPYLLLPSIFASQMLL